MSLDIKLVANRPVSVFDENIGSSNATFAKEFGIDDHIWNPQEIGITRAEQLITPLEDALRKMRAKRDESLQSFAGFVARYLQACHENPEAEIVVF